jgi:hypothetical protein
MWYQVTIKTKRNIEITSLQELAVNELIMLKACRRADEDGPFILTHWP